MVEQTKKSNAAHLCSCPISFCPCTGIEHDTLSQWQSSVGGAAFIEALFRKQLFSDSTQEISKAFHVVAQSITNLQVPVKSTQILAIISLSATVRKLVQAMLYFKNPDLPGLYAPHIDELLPCSWSERQNMITSFAPSLFASVSSLNKLRAARIVQHDSCTTARSSLQVQPATFPSDILLHQLQANTFLTLFQMSLLYSIAHVSSPELVRDARRACRQLPWASLRDLAGSLLEEGGPFISRGERSAVWERYAVTHFHGRLTLGCCNYGCMKMDGMSEAMLCTKLCSGCRRARYCSVRCQKAAWIDGGHKAVCRV